MRGNRWTRGLGVVCLLAGCGGGGGGSGGGDDGEWLGAALAETDETAGTTNARLVVGAGGHAVVSWSVFHGAGLTDVFVNHFDPATGWQGFYAPRRDIASATFPAMTLAIDATGNALGVWGERQALPGDPSTFYATTYRAGQGVWSVPHPMENDNTGQAQVIDIAAGPAGTFWVLFGLHRGTTVEIHVNRFVPATGWTGPVLLDSAPWDPLDTFLNDVHLAVDGAGNAVAAWSRYTDSDMSGTIDRFLDEESAFARRFDAGTSSWTALQGLNTSVLNGSFVSDVQTDPTGGFLIVWRQNDANSMSRGWGQFYLSTGLEAPQPLWDHADDLTPRGAAFDADGNAFVFADGNAIVAAVRYVAGDGWQGLDVLQDDVADDSFLETFAVNGDGVAFVLWRQGASDRDAYARRFDPGSESWGPERNLDDPNTGNVRSGTRLVVDADGNAMALWAAFDGVEESIWAVRFRDGGGWGDPEEIDAGDEDADNSGYGLGVDGLGRLIAVWSQGPTGDDRDVWFNRFE
jgi:hypothetical protein